MFPCSPKPLGDPHDCEANLGGAPISKLDKRRVLNVSVPIYSVMNVIETDPTPTHMAC